VGEKFTFDVLDSFMTPWYTLVCNNASAKSLWKEMIGEPVKGFSNVRWYCRAEIMMEIGRHFNKVQGFLQKLSEREIGDATTAKMTTTYNSAKAELRLSLAAMLDMRPIVKTTYELEGDRLEILLAFDRIEALRSLGRRLGDQGTLPNVDAVLRQDVQLKVGIKIIKLWGGEPFEAKVVGISKAASTLYSGQERAVYKVHYPDDDEYEELEDEEIRKLLVIDHFEVCTCSAARAPLPSPPLIPFGPCCPCVRPSQARKAVINSLRAGFDYLENRLTGNCARPYDCTHELAVFKAARVFDPSWASSHALDAAGVNALTVLRCLPPELIEGMSGELDKYLSAAADFEVDRSDVDSFTKNVLKFWSVHHSEIRAWAAAARIVFALTPNSASCERVFSQLACMFTPAQKAMLGDGLQASLMLSCNTREVG
jgi:hypothetical protein